MGSFHDIREHMQVIDAEWTPVGKIDRVEGDRIKLTRTEQFSGEKGGHHFVPAGLVADVEGDTVRLSARLDALEAIFESAEDEQP